MMDANPAWKGEGSDVPEDGRSFAQQSNREGKP